MKVAKTILASLVLLTAISFKDKNPRIVKTGTYGVCNCSESKTKVELTLNPDNTFTYHDNSNPKKIIDLKGAWVLEGETIKLKEHKADFRIHDKWILDENGKCLRSRKGLEFTRLCHIKDCN